MRTAECGVLSGERRDAHDLPGQTPHSALRTPHYVFGDAPPLPPRPLLRAPLLLLRLLHCGAEARARRGIRATDPAGAGAAPRVSPCADGAGLNLQVNGTAPV